ncbi:MAG: DUF72 domain-containing protein, partial [Bacteroidota bacterium]
AYPTGAKTKDYLRYYCQQFNTIELNTTHYRIPDLATVQKWKAAAGSDFRYCPKLPQSISHRRDMGLSSGQLLHFCEVIQELGTTLGCCFMQLPPYFGADRLSELANFLQKFPKSIPLAIEVRHESWFASAQAQQALFELLSAENTTAVITDVAGRRDVLHQYLTTGSTMIRFVGNGLHPTDYSRIDQWIERLQSWWEKGLHDVYFFTHEPDNVLAPQLAQYLAQQAQKKYSVKTRGPQLPFQAKGQQISLF